MQHLKHAIFLDFNAGAPLHPIAKEALSHFLENYSHLSLNPSSTHQIGKLAKKLIREAEVEVQTLFSNLSKNTHILWTSSATEANQTVIFSHFQPGSKNIWLVSEIEHPSVLLCKEEVEKRGGEVHFIPTKPDGIIDLESLDSLLKTKNVSLVSVQWVNNETGVIQPVDKVQTLLEAYPRVKFHCDGVQGFTKLPLSQFKKLPDFFTFSSHKIGGLPGLGGVIYSDSSLKPLLLGKQQKGLRGGTENVLAISVFSELLKKLPEPKNETTLRDQFETQVLKSFPDSIIHGKNAPRIGTTSFIKFPDSLGNSLVEYLDLQGIETSSGSACSSGVSEPSPVLKAMGYDEKTAKNSVRISFRSSEPEVKTSLEALIEALKKKALHGK